MMIRASYQWKSPGGSDSKSESAPLALRLASLARLSDGGVATVVLEV